MSFKVTTPIALESANRFSIDAFSIDLATMKLSYTFGYYLNDSRIKQQIVEVMQSELVAYMQLPLVSGATMYDALKRLLYSHAKSKGLIPADAIDESVIVPAPEPEPDPPAPEGV